MNKNDFCLIRLDDITPDMDWDKFRIVKGILNKYHICPIIGVVPESQDANLHKQENVPDFWSEICSLQDNGWKIAQHGTYHVYVTDNRGNLGINSFSEFAGLSYEEQLKKVQTGKDILKSNGIETDMFMAPGHTYDDNTLRALQDCGFCMITDGLYWRPYQKDKLVFLPCRLRGVKVSFGMDTVCLHTNQMSDKDMHELDVFCNENKDRIISFDNDFLAGQAVQYKIFITWWERIALLERTIKNRVSHSKRLAWYLNKTYHRSSLVKCLKRIFGLPILLFYKAKNQ